MTNPIAIIEKNSVEEIRIELSEFKGHKLLNIRTWTEGPAGLMGFVGHPIYGKKND